MKIVCSKCHTKLKNEFQDICHKCGHTLQSFRKHIIAKPHAYHIIRDTILFLLVLLLVFWAYTVYQVSKQDIIVQSPAVEMPEVEVQLPPITIPEREITINLSEFADKNKPLQRSTTVEQWAEAKRQQRS